MEIKREVFATLDRVAKPGAILATNTSTLDVEQDRRGDEPAAGRDRHALLQSRQRDEAAGGRARRADRRRRADDGDAAREAGSARRPWSRASATDSSATGWSSSICARRCSCWRRAPRRSRWTPRSKGFGMAMGPFRMSDLAGNDVGWRIRKRRYVEKPHVLYSRIADRLCEIGPLRAEDRHGLVPLRTWPARRDPRSGSRRADRRVSRRDRRRAARHRRRWRSSAAASLPW